ncbi:helix-turn-helix transcriptional regulator (plasmid) [Paenibacillus thiaminolyticus]|uniref:helix-turn-helix domain-containing protein n=1 Tax=Paenibacillus thiaminolyticus TaxID=49283 RepID=UPI00232B4FE2|nr:helix-turn-helix transcriptional regulator [Paenibacillus thiaminolyticus]WCF11740.1 helix-turn-helix transcriptional regulator [Paenibacillus thiaminolyticus]
MMKEHGSEKTLTWQEKFQLKVDNSGNEEVRSIWKALQDADELKMDITEEKIEELRHMIKYASIQAQFRRGFERKLKLLSNRVDRSISNDFGSLVKHLRLSQGLTLQDLSDMTGISTSYINRIENNQRKSAGYKMIEKLAVALGQEVSDLVDVANKPEEDEITSVEELLLSSNFEINGVRANKEVKERLVALISKINHPTWGDDKYTNVIEIADAIDRYRNLLNQKK